MAVEVEETFGPVAPLFRFTDEAAAIALANDTEFGLAAHFYGRDVGRIWRVAEAPRIRHRRQQHRPHLDRGAARRREGIGAGGREGSLKHGLEEFLEIEVASVWAGSSVNALGRSLLRHVVAFALPSFHLRRLRRPLRAALRWRRPALLFRRVRILEQPAERDVGDPRHLLLRQPPVRREPARQPQNADQPEGRHRRIDVAQTALRAQFLLSHVRPDRSRTACAPRAACGSPPERPTSSTSWAYGAAPVRRDSTRGGPAVPAGALRIVHPAHRR